MKREVRGKQEGGVVKRHRALLNMMSMLTVFTVVMVSQVYIYYKMFKFYTVNVCS